MTDPRCIVPYHDPYDTNLDYEYLNIVNDANPSLANFSSINEPAPVPLVSGGIVNIMDPNDPFDDPMLWNFCYGGDKRQSNEAGPSHQNQGQAFNGPINPSEQSWNEGIHEDSFHNGRPHAVWPTEPVPFQCTCCQVLREIIHTDGNYTTKLEIHGRMGIICHAILENRDHVKSIHPQYHFYDFCKKSMENVKEFLRKYCDDRRQAGFIMVQDPLSFFYEALCVGLDWFENFNIDDDFYDPSPTTSGERQAVNQTEGENDTERTPRSNLALQRERAGRLTLDDFRQYFHLPIEDAARRLNLCPTVVKKICRKYGMTRWPHRKVKSIQRQITELQVLLNSNVAEERARAQADILRLQQEMRIACSGDTG